MGYRRTIPPATEPLLVPEARLSSRIDQYIEDSLLADYIQTARQWIEEQWDLALISQTIEETFSSIPKSGVFRLTVRPFLAVTALKYYNSDNTLTTVNADQYVASFDGHHGIIQFKTDADSITTYDRSDAFVITYTAGFSTVPQYAKTAIRMKVTDLYEQRVSSVQSKGIDSYESLLSPLILRRA